MTSSICPPSSSPVPRITAFLMLSEGMETFLAARMAVRSRGLPSGSPPLRAAIMISLMIRVNDFPRLASRAAFLCLIVAHLEWPDIVVLLGRPASPAGYEFMRLQPFEDSKSAGLGKGGSAWRHRVARAVPVGATTKGSALR